MSKQALRVARFEIIRQFKKPAFWAATLLIPLFIGGIYLISFLSSQGAQTEPTLDENTKVAITDEVGIFSEDASFVVKRNKEQGIEMVKNGEVDLYFYIPEDFLESKKVEFYHVSEGLDIFNNDGELLRGLLAQDATKKVGELDALALTGRYEIKDNKLSKDGNDANALGKAVVPFAIGVVFFLFVALCGNRFLLTVVEEKENRISEMILTAISAKHLIVGKIIAMLTLGLVQIAVIVVPILVLVFLNRDSALVGSILATIEIDPLMLTLNLVLFVASVFFYAGACVLVGSMVSTARDASSFIGPAIVGMVLPLYFMQMFMAAEPSVIVQVFSYFPLTAPVALMLRTGFGTISLPEFCIGIAVVIAAAVVVVRLAVITFQKNAINFAIAKPKWLKKG